MKYWKTEFKENGISPFISSGDNRHNLPHIYIYYSVKEVVLSLPELEVLAGAIDKKNYYD